MAEIKKTNQHLVIDYMARDYWSLLRSMRGQIPEIMPEWKDFESEADFGNVLLQLFAHMGDILSYYQDRIANEGFLSTARSRRSIIDHLRLIGYRLSTAAPASADLSLYVPTDFKGITTIRKGNAFASKSTESKPSVRYEYTSEEDLVINWSNQKQFEIIEEKDGNGDIKKGAKRLKRFIHTIPVEEGMLICKEIIGKSNGRPNQRFQLSHPGIILRPVGLSESVNRDIIIDAELSPGDGQQQISERWYYRDTLAFSREEILEFTVEIDEHDNATVVFGDNDFGKIPKEDLELKATYRVGGGLHGNLPAGAIDTIADAPDLTLAGAQVRNEKPSTGGANRESIEYAIKHAPGVFRSGIRAVTAYDYENLARQFKGVGKVKAEAANWNRVNLYVAPQDGGRLMTDVFKHALWTYFEDKRPVTTRIEILDVTYVPVFVTATIGITAYHDTHMVRNQIVAAHKHLLSFDNVDLGKPVFLSKFYEAFEFIDGVVFVNITEFQRLKEYEKKGDDYVEEDGIIELGPFELAVLPPGMPGCYGDNEKAKQTYEDYKEQYPHGIRLTLQPQR